MPKILNRSLRMMTLPDIGKSVTSEESANILMLPGESHYFTPAGVEALKTSKAFNHHLDKEDFRLFEDPRDTSPAKVETGKTAAAPASPAKALSKTPASAPEPEPAAATAAPGTETK